MDPVVDTTPATPSLLTVASVALGIVAIAIVLVVVESLTDWRWAALFLALVLGYFSWLLDAKASPRVKVKRSAIIQVSIDARGTK